MIFRNVRGAQTFVLEMSRPFRHHAVRVALPAAGFLLAAANAIAAPGDGVVAVSLFKNGFASVTREFAVSGTTLTMDVPVASLGTLFFMSDDGSTVTVEAVPTSARKRRIPLQTMGDLLRANVGKAVVLREGEEEGRLLEGEIVAVGRDVVTLKMADGQRAVSIARVTELASSKSELRLEVEVDAADAPKSYRITKSKAGGRVRMTSLEPGLSWIPAYRIDLSDTKNATVIATSTIFNEDYDLRNVRARLVTGFPAARYRNVPEPLAARSGLPEWLAALARPEIQPPLRRDVAAVPAYGGVPNGIDFITYDPTDNSIVASAEYGRANYANRGYGGMGGGGFGGAASASYDGIQEGGGSGEALGELFFYEIPPLTLAKGVRRQENLFRFDAPYRHVNTFEIGPEYDENLNPIRRNQSDLPPGDEYARRQADARAAREAIWHEVEFENKAGQSLTGAVGSVVEDEELLGQGTVEFTPPGGKALVRLDRALDLVLDRREEVVLREPGAVKSTRFVGAYDRVTIRGTITVRNPRRESVILKGRKRTIGEMTIASPNGKIMNTEALLNGANGTSTAEWEVTVAPGATANLTYTYLLLTNR